MVIGVVKFYVILGAFLAVLVSLLLVAIAPATGHFNPENYGWNGLSNFVEEYKAEVVYSADKLKAALKPGETVLVIVGPEKLPSADEISVISGFLEDSGLVLLMDDFGTGSDILNELGVLTSISNYLVIDPLFKERNSKLPKAVNVVKSWVTSNVTTLCLNYASSLEPYGAKVLVSTSEYSYLDINGNEKPDPDEPRGPFPVVAMIKKGNGMIIVVSDSSIAINSMIYRCDNKAFITNIVKGKRVIVYGGLWEENLGDKVRLIVRRIPLFLKPIEIRFIVACSVAVIIYKTYITFKRMVR